MKIFLIIIATFFGAEINAQIITDSVITGTAVVIKDPRIDILGKKMAEYNATLGTVTYTNGLTSAKGYRLMVLSTNDRNLVMKIRAELYQMFPDQKLYMSYQIPNIKVKLGNFLERADADKARKQIIAAKLVTGNVYVLPETIEVKPPKEEKEKE
ncbi:MAG: hypothetical protein LH615_07180 [Ferruginibacter sp.]|nr:hypothetical protein [Ferruginibacter sp.]